MGMLPFVLSAVASAMVASEKDARNLAVEAAADKSLVSRETAGEAPTRSRYNARNADEPAFRAAWAQTLEEAGACSERQPSGARQPSRACATIVREWNDRRQADGLPRWTANEARAAARKLDTLGISSRDSFLRSMNQLNRRIREAENGTKPFSGPSLESARRLRDAPFNSLRYQEEDQVQEGAAWSAQLKDMLDGFLLEHNLKLYFCPLERRVNDDELLIPSHHGGFQFSEGRNKDVYFALTTPPAMVPYVVKMRNSMSSNFDPHEKTVGNYPYYANVIAYKQLKVRLPTGKIRKVDVTINEYAPVQELEKLMESPDSRKTTELFRDGMCLDAGDHRWQNIGFSLTSNRWKAIDGPDVPISEAECARRKQKCRDDETPGPSEMNNWTDTECDRFMNVGYQSLLLLGRYPQIDLSFVDYKAKVRSLL